MRILVNDFIGGVLDRGMPLYVRNLIDGLEQQGYRISFIRAPSICRRLPRNVFYLISVLVEQTVLPVIGMFQRADVTLYPYNSVSIIDLLTRRGRIVVHDLEQLNRPLSLSKLYYLACYRVLKWLDWPVYTISALTRQRLTDSGRFGHGAITILPNTFYAFEHLLRGTPPSDVHADSILLCTGSTANKDLESVMRDYLPKVLASGVTVSILGLHKTTDAPRLAPLDKFITTGQLRLCGQLSDLEVAAEYQRHNIIWVHSLREGFGRCVVEGRLAQRRVICSDIPEFTDLRDGEVYLYKDPAGFMTALDRLRPLALPSLRYDGYPYGRLLREAMNDGSLGSKPRETGLPDTKSVFIRR